MDKIKQIAEQFAIRGIQTYYVGGMVRDKHLGIPNDDIDICLVGVKDKSIVPHIIERFGKCTEEVGKSFPTWIAIIDDKKIDVALARTEKKVGTSHQDFVCETKDVTILEDLYRRDFTMNAMAINVLTDEWLDPYNGKGSLFYNVLDPTSSAFMEDALRVYRGARFCARFNLKPSYKFYQYAWLCDEETQKGISAERVGIELMKTFSQCEKPSIFFNILAKCFWLQDFFPELVNLTTCEQNPDYHPEGNAYIHTLHTIDAIPLSHPSVKFYRTVMLCHDLGKYGTTELNSKGKWTAIGHEPAGIPLADALMRRLSLFKTSIQRKIKMLILLHMIRINLTDKVVKQGIRKLSSVGLTWDNLVTVCQADCDGRPPLPKKKVDMREDYVDELYDNMTWFTPLVDGELLIKMGYKKSPLYAKVINRSLEIQDKGNLTKENMYLIVKQLMKAYEKDTN